MKVYIASHVRIEHRTMKGWSKRCRVYSSNLFDAVHLFYDEGRGVRFQTGVE